MIINIISLIALLALSAFFSGAETAFMASNRVRIRELANQGDLKAKQVDKLLEDQTKLLTTILIGNNLVNISASAIATAVAITLFGKTGVGIATGVVTFLILIFGEITPKSLGNNHAIRYAKSAAPLLFWLEKLLYPLVRFFSFLIKRIVGDKQIVSSAFLSEEEIRRFVNVSEEEGVIKEAEREMIQSIFDFDDIRVKEIMIPRIEMVCIDQQSSIMELVQLAVEKGHSRIPVYHDTIDDIIGLVYVKDLLGLIIDDTQKQVRLSDFIKPVHYIPESQPINHLLADMKKRKEHLAIVIDEYGGTSGLITIEDLLEEIVGDIQDEFDLEAKLIEVINNQEILIDGRVDIDELNDFLPEPLLEDDSYETISGFILHFLGHLPTQGERIEIDGLKIEIAESSEHRIEKVRIISERPIDYNES